MELSIYSYSVAWRWLTQSDNASKFIAACVRNNITKAILQADPTVMAKFTEEPNAIASNILAFRNAGIEVFCAWNSRGVPGFDTLSDGYTLHQMIDFVFKYNNKYPDSRFSGIEFDCEPPAGSTMDQHAAHLESCITMIQDLRNYSLDINGTQHSIASEAMPVWMFNDPRWGNGVCADPWRRLCDLLDVIELDGYRFGGTLDGIKYPEGIYVSVACHKAALDKIIEAGKKFLVIISCTESSKYSDEDMSDGHFQTRYGLGVDGCNKAIDDFSQYYSNLYPDNYIGCGYYYDIDSWLHFNMLQNQSVTDTAIDAGSNLVVNYTTWRKEESYLHKVFGVKLDIEDSSGKTYSTSKICDLQEGATENRDISIPIPLSASSGPASYRLSIYGIEYISPAVEGADPNWPMLYYGNYSGYQSLLLNMSIDELYSLTAADTPNGVLTGRRPTPILLQTTGWVDGVTIKGVNMNIIKIINILLKVNPKIQVISSDVSIEAEPSSIATFDVIVKSNSSTDTPVFISLDQLIDGITLITTSGVAKANSETVIPVQIQVGEVTAGDYALQCSISRS